MTQAHDVRFAVEGVVGRITLDRPQALNALTFAMIEAMDAQLTAWARDPAIALVMIDGAGGKAFCAGGDIQLLYQAMRSGDLATARRFFEVEYRLNHRIATYPKPYVALMQGIVIGGGVGVSAHGSHRIVTDKTLLALPECSIGLIPDVGATHLLGHAPGRLGEYIGLTGLRLNGPDAVAAGLADVVVPAGDITSVVAEIVETGRLDVFDDIGRTPVTSKLDAMMPEIDAAFSADSVPEIADRLAASKADWAPAAHRAIQQACPLSLHCALVAIRAARDEPDVWDALRREYRFVWRALAQHDFAEGIRAAVIDKDRKPQWSRALLTGISADAVGAMLDGLGPDELNRSDAQ
jgi:enoyl-CoA hydratase/carnithine racemase